MRDPELLEGASPAELDAAVKSMMEHVGARVRKARDTRRMPRRVLSERSGVSMRYLAQLEAGSGNISIALLMRVAMSLDLPLEWFVTPGAHVKPATDAHADPRAGRICLIGLRGAGKSTLGRGLAAHLGLPFAELNRDIEALGGMPVSEIMALYGPEGYRRLEAQALETVIARESNAVLAVGGGLVAEPATYKTLLEHCHTVWVQASPEDHMARVRAQGDLRPMQGNPHAMAQLRSILSSRTPLYAQAGHSLDTSGQTPQDSLSDLIALISGKGLIAR